MDVVGSMDKSGFLTLKDRSKDVVISGGSNIYPREVEEALLTLPRVLETSVVGAADPKWGEAIVAFVVVRAGASVPEKDLDAVCFHNIARFNRPKRFVFVDALPKNNYGKALKTELRKLLSASEQQGFKGERASACAEEAARAVRYHLVEVLQ
jgi:long-chain acyl-CoA synthetase